MSLYSAHPLAMKTTNHDFVSIRAILVSTTAKPPAECGHLPPIKIQNSKIDNPLKPPFFKAFQTFSKINI